MDPLPLLLALVGFLVALGLGWFAWARPLGTARADLAGARAEAAAREAELGQLREQGRRAEAEAGRALALETELAALKAAQAERDAAHARQIAELDARFATLATQALEAAQGRFVQQAEETLKRHQAEVERRSEAGKAALAELMHPIRETFGRLEQGVRELEAKREQAYGSLSEQLRALVQTEEAMRAEAGRIVAALKGSAKATGAWGEAQLRRVLEVGGLTEGIDFTLQASADDGEGARSRPDAILHLPGGRQLIVDAKCALDDHVAAQQATTDRERAEARARHAARIRAHARSLAEKAYWDQFTEAPDFVLMFVPGENFLTAALEEDPALHLWAMERKVLLVGPTNLLAIARVIAMVWRQEKMAKEAHAIGDLGAELYERLKVMAGHMNRVGRNIDDTARAWNQFVGSVESRVLVTGRKLGELGADRKGEALPEGRGVETTARLLQAEEAQQLGGNGREHPAPG